MQAGWKDPSRFILGHPFNPPHLIPLVELLGNEKTAPDVLDPAEAFYAEIGKVTIRVNKEVPGHVANRLQAALWREVLHLAQEGVASVEDIDTAVWAGPGLRWGAMGPTSLFDLGAGPGGLPAFLDRYGSHLIAGGMIWAIPAWMKHQKRCWPKALTEATEGQSKQI